MNWTKLQSFTIQYLLKPPAFSRMSRSWPSVCRFCLNPRLKQITINTVKYFSVSQFTKSCAGWEILLVPNEAEIVAAEAEVLDVEPEAGSEGGGDLQVPGVLGIGAGGQLGLVLHHLETQLKS